MTSALSWARELTSDPLSAVAFRRGRPGAAQWAALAVPGALAGGLVAVGAGWFRPLGPGRALGIGIGIGSAAGVVLGRVIAEIRWRRIPVSLAVDEPDVALDLMQAVRARGVQADMVRTDEDPTDGRADQQSPGGRHYALRYRAKDDRRVRAALAEQQR